MKPYKGALKKTLQRHWIGYFQGIYRESPFVYPIEEGDFFFFLGSIVYLAAEEGD